MSQYATVDEFRAWLGSQASANQPGQFQQLTGRVDGKTESASVATTALENASGVIDSYLAGRYSLPLSTVPDAIRLCTIRLAAYDAAVASGIRDEVIARLKLGADDCMKWLDKVASGQISLPSIAEPSPAFSGGAARVVKESTFGQF